MGNEGGLPLQFRILGPLEVVRGDKCLAFRGNRERAVLALLVLHANRTVSAERLAEDLWSGDPPEGAIHSLRVYVSRLRQALGAAGEAVVTRPSAYELQVDPGTIDALRFEELVARGRDEAKAGDHSGAAATLREALALWRGPALADVADAPFAQAQAGRLEEARLAAVEDRIEADLACGRHGEVTAELEALTGEHPFRERLWSQRIIALYRSGRQADALRAYQQLRSTLGEQLGIEPSPALQQLEGAVLRHDPALDWHPPVERVATAPGRLPQPLVGNERLPLVGREVELSRLDQLWQATRSGQRQLVLVAGEPGIGKSRLAAEFARTGHGRGAPVVFGRCDEGMGVPYQPFVEALSRYLRQTSRPTLGRLAGELVRLDPEVGERVHDLSPPLRSDPETERYRLFDAVAAWLGAMSEAAPVLFVIEDLHWATKPTLLLLSHLLRSDEDLRLLLLVTFRDTPLDMSPDLADLVAELLRQPGVERVRLAGLDEPGVGALMEAQAGHDLDDEGWALARMVHGETAGNPFYVREMLSLLAEKGGIVRRDGRWVPGLPLAQLDVPDSVRDVVERRLTRLPDRTSEMLALAAVLGERIDLTVLAEASGESESSVVETLRTAVSARLVNETDAGRYQFIHALVRSVLEDALGPTRRVQLHGAAGSAVEAVHAGHLDTHLPELAYHFARARDVERAIHYASRAGDRALTLLANDEAAAYYQQALEFLDLDSRPDDPTLRIDLLTGLGEAQRRTGDPASRQTLLDAARLAADRGDVARLVRAMLTNSRGIASVIGHVDEERLELIQTALDLVGSAPSAERAELLVLQAAELVFAGDHQRVLQAADEAGAIAAGLDDLTARARVGVGRLWACSVADRVTAMVPEAAHVVALADATGDPHLRVQSRLWSHYALLPTGDLGDARLRGAEAMAIADETGQPGLRFLAHVYYATAADALGEHREAERLMQTAVGLGQEANFSDTVMWYGAQMWLHWIFEGQPEVAAAVAAPVLVGYPRMVAWQGAQAVGLALSGRGEELGDFLAGLPALLHDVPVDFIWLAAHSLLAVAMGFGVENPEAAGAIYDLLLPYRSLHVAWGIGYLGPVELVLGILARVRGDDDLALAHHQAAAATIEACGAARARALNGYQWARTLLARDAPGDRRRALALAEETLGYCRAQGYTTFVTKTEEILSSFADSPTTHTRRAGIQRRPHWG